MAVRVLHLRKLAQLLKVHHVQGLKTPQGDCHHPTKHLLQHTGSLIKCDRRQITTEFNAQATHDIYRLSSPPLHSPPPPQIPDTGAKPLHCTHFQLQFIKPFLVGVLKQMSYNHPLNFSTLHCQILHCIFSGQHYVPHLYVGIFSGMRSQKMQVLESWTDCVAIEIQGI